MSLRFRRRSAIAKILDKLRRDAETDGLTGLVNHRVFQERLRIEVKRAQRHRRPLSLALVDIDGFKLLNDTFGHQIGDDVLETVAGQLASVLRVNDIAARIGGDEFALLLPGDGRSMRRTGLRRASLATPSQPRDASTGLPASRSRSASATCRHAKNADSLLRLADGALYSAQGTMAATAICRSTSPELVRKTSRLRSSAAVACAALARRISALFAALARAIDAKDPIHADATHERVRILLAPARRDRWTGRRTVMASS